MSGDYGSTRLTPEQSEEMHRRYGIRYTHVQTGVRGLGLSRALRRRLERAQKKAR